MIVAIVLVFPHRIYSNYLVGEPQGIIGTHNFVEADSSNTRDDLYMTGNNYALSMTKFEEWYSMSTDGTFNLNLMAELAKNRMEQTKQTNPNFYCGPVTGLLARNAGYIFPGRLLRNYSEEDPEGVLSMLDLDPSVYTSLTDKSRTAKENIRVFYSIYGGEGNFTYREGWERIPENWYKMPVDFGLVQLNLDTVDWLTKYPELGR